MATAALKSDLLKILSVVATILASFLLFSGGFVVVRFAGNYSARDLTLFGLLPLVGGACWLALAAWFWSRAVAAASMWDSIGLISLRAMAAIALALLGQIVMQKLRGHPSF
jgi:hypothetical protein